MSGSMTALSTPVEEALSDKAGHDKSGGKQPLDLSWHEWKWPLFFLLCTSAAGLYFPLAYLLLPIILVNRFRNDRYDFVIMVTVLCGGYGMTTFDTFKVNLYYVAYIVAILAILLFRKTPLMKKIITAWVLYVIALFTFAMMSEETMLIQMRRLMPYQAIIYFLVPMMAFAGQNFDIRVFFRRVMPYCFIICLWYVLDGCVFGGWIFLPNTYISWEGAESTFLSPIILGPSAFPRKYPPGLFLLTLGVYPIVKYYKLNWWQWTLIAAALCVCRTFTIILGFAAVYIFLQGKLSKLLKYGVVAVLFFVSLYGVDSVLTGGAERESGSVLRVKSSIDQLFDLQNIQDEEDLARAGTGRMAQALPKLELLYELDREWIGFGFLDEERTTMTKYIIYNPLYMTSDVFKREEVATGVEITVIQHLLNIGYLGLLVVVAFYSYLCFLVRKHEYRMYFYSMILSFVIFGIAGFSGLIYTPGLLLIALSLAAMMLDDKRLLGING